MPLCLLWKRVPGYTIPMVPMHLPPMAPLNLVEQIRALRGALSPKIEAHRLKGMQRSSELTG
jgi:hypothetical protein